MGCKSSDKTKPKHRKGLWSPEEDQKLRNYVLKHGHGCWSSVPINARLQRNGKSCRLRWINYLRPGLKRGVFTAEEEETILTLHRLLGNKWSQMAQHLPGRTDNEIKNYWHSYLKKKVLKEEGLMEAKKTTNSDNNNKETSPSPSPSSPKEPTIQTPTYDSQASIEKSPTHSVDQSVPQLLDSPKQGNRSCLPKLMFAEWLSLDSFSSLGDQLPLVYKVGNDHNVDSSFCEIFMQNYLLNEGTFFSSSTDYHNSPADGSPGDIFSSQFKFEFQSCGNDQFVDFSSGEDICSDFNMKNFDDVMYIDQINFQSNKILGSI